MSGTKQQRKQQRKHGSLFRIRKERKERKKVKKNDKRKIFFSHFFLALPTYQCININECQLAYDVCPDGFICRDLEGSYECLRDLRPLYISLPTIVATIIFLVCNFFLYRWLKRKYSLGTKKRIKKEKKQRKTKKSKNVNYFIFFLF